MTEHPNAPRGWHSRGYLPHFDGGRDHPQSVTFRLADSLPASAVEHLAAELSSFPPTKRSGERRKRVEAVLDAGRGACHLRHRPVGSLVEAALLHFDADRYRMHAWVVMPNHVHALFTPTPGHPLSDVVGSWKSFTAKEANRLLGRAGQFWHEDYFDRYIRDEVHFAAAAGYIENNPVKAGLCRRPEDWPFGSARLRPTGCAAVPGENQATAAGTAALHGADS